MVGKRTALAIIAFGIYGIDGSVAHAQGMIGIAIGNAIASVGAGRQEEACLRGMPQPSETVAKVRAGADQSLRDYFRVAGATGAADTRSAFISKKELQSWSRDGQKGSLTAVDDPLARAVSNDGNLASMLILDDFIFAGDGRSAVGFWHVPGVAHEQPQRGWYKATFLQERNAGTLTWKIAQLEITSGAAPPPTIHQFCHRLGDVDEFLTRRLKNNAKGARKTLEREGFDRSY